MKFLLLLGWRNLYRRKWRSMLTGAMFFLGSYMLVFMFGLSDGVYGEMIDMGTITWNGDFQVLADDYHASPSLFENLKDADAFCERLEADPRVEAVSRRVEAAGLLSKDTTTMGAFVVGLNPQQEFATVMKTVSQGDWWTDYDEYLPIVLGKGVARRLKVSLGDEVTFIGQAADGSIAADLFQLVGIIDSGINELDRNLAVIPLQAAQELLVLEGRVHRIVGKVTDKKFLPALLAETALPETAEILTWEELTPELAQTIKADSQGLYLFMFIIMLVVLLGVANTMMMSVMERTHELGVIQALGTSPPMIVTLILAEIFWLGLIGIGSGVLLGVFTNWALAINGIPTGMDDFGYGGVNLDVAYPINSIKGALFYPMLVLVCGMLSGLLPGIKAALTKPSDAMRN